MDEDTESLLGSDHNDMDGEFYTESGFIDTLHWVSNLRIPPFS